MKKYMEKFWFPPRRKETKRNKDISLFGKRNRELDTGEEDGENLVYLEIICGEDEDKEEGFWQLRPL